MNRRSLPRSERIRQRRRTSPQVTRRAVWDDFARAGRGRSRRYEVTVGSFVRVPGRLPLLRGVSFNSVARTFWMLLMLGIVLGGLYFVFGTPYFRVDRPQIEGLQWVSPQEVEAALEADGHLLFTLSASELESRLYRRFPEFAEVEVRLSLPNRLEVRVRERQPVIYWELDGRYTWVDAEGIAIRPRGEMPNLLHVRALTPSPPQPASDPLRPPAYLSVEMVEALRHLAIFLPPGTTFLYDAHYGFGWEDAHGGRVFFGQTPDEMPARAQVYLYLSRFLNERGIYPALIDLRYPDAPYYRLEPGDG